jgi:hypothetical protein
MDEDRTLVRPLLDDVEGSIDDELATDTLLLLLQTAIVLEHQAAARALVARLVCVADLAVGEWFYTSVGRPGRRGCPTG